MDTHTHTHTHTHREWFSTASLSISLLLRKPASRNAVTDKINHTLRGFRNRHEHPLRYAALQATRGLGTALVSIRPKLGNVNHKAVKRTSAVQKHTYNYALISASSVCTLCKLQTTLLCSNIPYLRFAFLAMPCAAR
jgi:hypothetical protein